MAAASVFASLPTFAAQQLTTIADEDSRLNVILLLFVPVLGWVGFNILGPINNQLNTIKEKKNSLAAGLAFITGLALASEPSMAAMDVGTLATSGAKFASVYLFLVAMGIWIAMYFAAENDPRKGLDD